MTAAGLSASRAPTWRTALLRHAPVAFLGAWYLYVAGVKSALKPLWFDEIVTYYVASIGSPRVIIEALLARADNHPPLDYIVRNLSMSLFGATELGMRVPSMIAFLVAALCLYVIVLRRTSIMPALVAFSFPFFTFALLYASEARAYAPLMASMCLSFLAWQLATEKTSFARLAFLTLCLSLGTQFHYYGVLNFLPIAVGEAIRSWERRQIAWPIVACFAVAVATIGLLLPFILHSREFASHFWTKFGPGLAVYIYGDLLSAAVPAAMAALFGCAIAIFFFRREEEVPAANGGIPRHEVAAALTMCLVPVSTYVLAALVTHAFADKYVINTVAGVALVTAYITWAIERHSRRCARLIAVIFCAWAAANLGYVARYTPQRHFSVPAAELRVIENATVPVALFDAHLFMTRRFYLPRQLRDKVYILTDRKLAIANTGHDTDEIVFGNLERFLPMHAANLCEFTKQHPKFLIMQFGPTWVIQQLLKDNAQLQVVPADLTKATLYSVTTNGPSGC